MRIGDWSSDVCSSDLLTSLMRDPISARDELLGRAVYQFLVGNPDAHAKNYSIVYRGDGTLALSKLYDVNNAAAFRSHYKEQLPRLAMFVGGERDPTRLAAGHWRDFADEVGIGHAIVHARRIPWAHTNTHRAPRPT